MSPRRYTLTEAAKAARLKGSEIQRKPPRLNCSVDRALATEAREKFGSVDGAIRAALTPR